MPENKQWLRKIAIFFGVLIGGIVLACAGLNFILGDPCGYEELKRVSSPDKRFDAVLVEANCGATTDYAYWVSVVPQGSKDYRKSVFVADRLDVNEIGLDWTGDRLTIGLPAQYREYKRHTHASLGWGKSVEIKYVER